MIALLLTAMLLPTGCYPPPLDAPVVDAFRAPACAFCPGNRGLEYRPATGTPVRAVAGGTVTFSGSVAGTVYVVVLHDDGLRATYGRLALALVAAGALVRPGRVVGLTTDRFFFGLRDGDTYIDPAPMLGRLHRQPRLLPLDGTPARAGRSPTINCTAR